MPTNSRLEPSTYVLALCPIDTSEEKLKSLVYPLKNGSGTQFVWSPARSKTSSDSFFVLGQSTNTLALARTVISEGGPLSALFSIDGKAAMDNGLTTIEEILSPLFWVNAFPYLQVLYIPRRLYDIEAIDAVNWKSFAAMQRRQWRQGASWPLLFPFINDEPLTPNQIGALHVELAATWLSNSCKDASLAAEEMEHARRACTSEKVLHNWAITQTLIGNTTHATAVLRESTDSALLSHDIHLLENRHGVEPPLQRKDWIAASDIDPIVVPSPQFLAQAIHFDGSPLGLHRILLNPNWENDYALLGIFEDYFSTFGSNTPIDLLIPRMHRSLDEVLEILSPLLHKFGNGELLADITIDDAESAHLLPHNRYDAVIDMNGKDDDFHKQAKMIFTAVAERLENR